MPRQKSWGGAYCDVCTEESYAPAPTPDELSRPFCLRGIRPRAIGRSLHGRRGFCRHHLRGTTPNIIKLGAQILRTLPCLLTIIVLVGRAIPPVADGEPYEKQYGPALVEHRGCNGL